MCGWALGAPLERIPGLLRGIIESQDGLRFAYPTQTVSVAGGGASSRTGSPRVTASPSAA